MSVGGYTFGCGHFVCIRALDTIAFGQKRPSFLANCDQASGARSRGLVVFSYAVMSISTERHSSIPSRYLSGAALVQYDDMLRKPAEGMRKMVMHMEI